ncbi:helix-turn-helix domain-containing protein [Limosilactobacillus fermentum]
MTKFNLELRISIVTQYLTGISSIQLARKYHIANNETILLWVHRFNHFGIAGLKPRPMNLEYSSEFKIEVLNWKQQHQASLSETALHFNLSSPSTIWQWQRKFDLKGLSGLNRVRGDPKTMAKHKHKKVTKPTTAQIQARHDKDELKQLKQENKMLRIENEFLKKLDALDHEKSAHAKP